MRGHLRTSLLLAVLICMSTIIASAEDANSSLRTALDDMSSFSLSRYLVKQGWLPPVLFAQGPAPKADTPPECPLSVVSILQPVDGATFYIDTDVTQFTLIVTAEVDCTEDTARIEFFVQQTGQGAPTSIGVDNIAPYEASALVSYAGSPSQQLVVTAVATSIYDGAQVTDTATLTLKRPAATDDFYTNGIPDNPYGLFRHSGDWWLSRVRMSLLSTYMMSSAAAIYPLYASEAFSSGDFTLRIQNPVKTNQWATVTVSRRLLLSGEAGLLLVQVAPTLISLLGEDEANAVKPEPAGGFGGDGSYAEVSLLTTTDGVNFSEISATRLASYPVQIKFEGLPFVVGENYILKSHSTFVVNQGRGLEVLGEDAASWSQITTQSINTSAGTATATLRSLSTIAPYLVTAEGEGEGEGESYDWWDYWGVWFALLVPLIVLQFVGGGVGGSGGPCFIATAAYGTPLAGQIDTLRMFRDTYLLDSALGTAFVDAYYRISPPLADLVAEHPLLAALVRVILIPIIALCRMVLTAPHLVAFALLLTCVWWISRRRQRRA